jgi:hypothetical protein
LPVTASAKFSCIGGTLGIHRDNPDGSRIRATDIDPLETTR